MASYQADIQIGVKGKAQLNQLESQLTRVNKAVKELNKALVLKTRAQTIKLNTKGAMNAVRDLENRINRLGRTITVNLRVNEKESKKASSGGTTLIASNPKAQSTALAAAVASSRALTIADEQRLQINQQLSPKLQQQANLLKQIEDQTDKITKNRKEAENIERGFGSKARLNQLNFGYDALNRKLQRLKGEYKGVTGEVENYKRAADRVNDDEIIRTEKRRQRVNDLRRRRQQAQGVRRAAGAGVGIAATQIPGLGGVASGALAGFAVGGPGGAAIGAAVAGVTELTAALAAFSGESAKFFNALQLSRKALANTVQTTEEYKAALEGIRGVSQDFLVPIDEATSQFTKLNAAARASGFTVEEVTEVYRGLAAANTALGGNSERLQGILLATQQVFSKGKVQAEELRGQIGERLAGAFAKFAKAAGLSTSELDKALEKGEVSLEDFVKFSRSLLDEYEEDAKRLAKEPENAAERLERAMDNLKEALGPITRQIINLFNEMATAIVNSIATAIAWINKAQMAGAKGKIRATDRNVKQTQQRINEIDTTPGRRGSGFGQVSDSEYRGLEQQLELQIKQRAQARQDLKDLVDVITPSGNAPEVKLPPAVTSPTGGSKSGGGSKSVRESQLPALQRELALKQQIDAIDQKIIEANKVKDTDLVIRLEGQQRLAEIAKSRLDILAEEIPPLEKKTKLAINELEAKKAIRDTDEELNAAARDRQQAIDDSIRGFQNEIELAGVRNEAARELLKIEQDIREMRQPGQNFTKAQIQAYRAAAQGAAAAREEQRQYNEVLSQVQGPVSALTSGLRDVVSGTKTAQEAFADFLNTIANQLIQTAATMIAQYIAIGIARTFAGIPASGNTSNMTGFFNPGVFTAGPFSSFGGGNSFGGFFADGGTLGAGKWGIAGESGPEVVSGPATITPMSGGDTTVNIVVNTSGGGSTSSQGEKAKEAQALGRMVEASVVSIINREKRPGGILTR